MSLSARFSLPSVASGGHRGESEGRGYHQQLIFALRSPAPISREAHEKKQLERNQAPTTQTNKQIGQITTSSLAYSHLKKTDFLLFDARHLGMRYRSEAR